MKKLVCILLLILCFNQIEANHIVGGEIELVSLGNFRYRINLIQYFDLAQNVNPGPEANIFVYTFRKRDNAVMRIDTLAIAGNSLVEYSNVLCTIEQLSTLQTRYSRDVTLSPELFNDPDGYYMVWERCCRNFAISNIVNPGGTGMTYYLEFPPVVKNGQPFINSSPQLFPPLSDYACVNQLYYVDFAGTDVDGDSIVYSLINPSNSSALVAVPIPTPAPHPVAQFRPGIGVTNMVPGLPALNISTKGFITVRPTSLGLYVFSIKAAEYRDGMKIGEVRRDFQLLVIGGCEPPAPPKITLNVPGQPNFNPDTDILNYTVGDVQKCFDINITDPSGLETINIRAVGVNFDQDVNDILSIQQGFVFPGKEVLTVTVCVSDCPYVRDGPFILDLIASDEACPQAQLDTIRVRINVQPPSNMQPTYSGLPTGIQQAGVNETLVYNIVGLDSDLDFMDMELQGENFEPSEFGFSLLAVTDQAGRIERRLVWNTDCTQFNFGERTDYKIKLLLEDRDECMFEDPALAELAFIFIPPNNTPPTISTSLNATTINSPLSGVIRFNVNGLDADNDIVELSAEGVGFTLAEVNAQFTSTSTAGSASGVFTLDLTCAGFDYQGIDQFEFNLIAEDLDECKEPNRVVTRVTINLVIPPNTAPEFTVDSPIEVFVNQQSQIEIPGIDIDNDFITVDLLRSVFLEGFQFQRGSGQGSAAGTIDWSPDCSYLGDDFEPRTYTLDFVVRDNSCPNSKADTMSVAFVLKEPIIDGKFKPANAFSPNGDGVNDTFTMAGLDDSTKNLPPDLCESVFEYIKIVDRTGVEVFSSSQRDFSWDGGGRASGSYFFYIKYTQSEYKGYVRLLR
jgi:hypothetical protein